MPAFIRVAGGIYDRKKRGWVQDPDRANHGTYETEPVYFTGPADAPAIAVIGRNDELFTVVHAATGLAVPAGFPGVSAATGLHANSLTRFRTKTAARRFMLALDDAGILPADREPTKDELLALKAWLGETYPVAR